MKTLKFLIPLVILLTVQSVLANGVVSTQRIKRSKQTFVDIQTPKNSVPTLNPDSSSGKLLKSWKLVFSDEFNDTKIDTAKLHVESSIKKRVDITLYADSNQVEEKDGNMHDTEYHTYGFEWTPTYLKFYFDGKVVARMTDPNLIPHVAHYLYFSGSCFGKNDWLDGDIRKNEFIQNGGVDKAYIDYVRVYQNLKQ